MGLKKVNSNAVHFTNFCVFAINTKMNDIHTIISYQKWKIELKKKSQSSFCICTTKRALHTLTMKAISFRWMCVTIASNPDTKLAHFITNGFEVCYSFTCAIWCSCKSSGWEFSVAMPFLLAKDLRKIDSFYIIFVLVSFRISFNKTTEAETWKNDNQLATETIAYISIQTYYPILYVCYKIYLPLVPSLKPHNGWLLSVENFTTYYD